MTIREHLSSLAPCQIPDAYFKVIGGEVGADIEDDVANIDRMTLNRLTARLYLYLATLPNVSEGGVSISFTATEKDTFLKLAKRYAQLAGENGLIGGATYGYKGQNI